MGRGGRRKKDLTFPIKNSSNYFIFHAMHNLYIKKISRQKTRNIFWKGNGEINYDTTIKCKTNQLSTQLYLLTEKHLQCISKFKKQFIKQKEEESEQENHWSLKDRLQVEFL